MPSGIALIAIIIFGLYIFTSIKILPEYERGVIFRLGRLLPEAKGPGIFLVFAPIDRMVRVSERLTTATTTSSCTVWTPPILMLLMTLAGRRALPICTVK